MPCKTVRLDCSLDQAFRVVLPRLSEDSLLLRMLTRKLSVKFVDISVAHDLPFQNDHAVLAASARVQTTKKRWASSGASPRCVCTPLATAASANKTVIANRLQLYGVIWKLAIVISVNPLPALSRCPLGCHDSL